MPYKKKWKEILPANKEILEIELKSLVNEYLNFENKNLIFFDLETLGFHPTFEYEQITEIAATFVNGRDSSLQTNFKHKISLSNSARSLIEEVDSIERFNWEKRQKRRGKTAFTSPNEILAFTKYYENTTEYIDEKIAIKKFFEFLSSIKNPVIIAHNTEFDVNYILTRSRRYGLEMPHVEILDTLKISRFFFIPTLKTLSENNEANKILSQLSRYQPSQKKKIHISSRLGDLANAFDIDSTEWHTADADVKMMLQVFYKMVSFFEKNIDLDISKNKRIAFFEVFKKLKKRM